jgi:branched-subunit amino acid aminotransferase/4-amino-4-deoxychorismate lyase
MRATVVLVDGEERDPSAPAVGPLDAGLLGHGVYESIRTYEGVPFALAEHLGRLAQGASRLGIECPVEALTAEVRHAVVRRVAVGETRIRLYLTAGGRRIAIADALPDRVRERDHGLAATVLPWRRDPHNPLTGVKASSTAAVRVAQRWLAERDGGQTGIWVTPAGNVSEALAANVFVVVDGVLSTPPLADGPLAGVTRDKVLAYAAAESIAVAEASIDVAALAGASEAFVSATSEPVVPLVALDGTPIGDGRPGPITVRVQEIYDRYARASVSGANAAG